MKTSAAENTIDPASANQPEKKLSGFAAGCSDIQGSERNPETLEVLKTKPSCSQGGDLDLWVLKETGRTEMIRLNSHVIATNVAPTWLPVTLIGHCVAVFSHAMA